MASRNDIIASVLGKASGLHWFLLVAIIGIAVFGAAVLVSVSQNDPSLSHIASQHVVRFGLTLAVALAVALTPLHMWARVAWPAYIGALVLLVLVELFGASRGGAQRWLVLGPVQFQPSEFMKIAILLALARFYQQVASGHEGIQLKHHIVAATMLLAPTALVLKQPDLGTALMIAATGGAVIILAGLDLRIIMGGFAAGVATILFVIFAPPEINFLLKDYQRERVLTFLDPGRDPLGAGYQLQQAKIAIGSGQLSGKGYQQGTQSQNEYIPEQHTDFIFTIVAEEFGFLGSIGLLAAWGLVLIFGLRIASQSKNLFGALLTGGVVATLAFYIVVNIGMVMGLLPVVGVPLPLLSYGGTVMMTVMVGIGLVLGAHLDRDMHMTCTSWIDAASQRR